MHPNLDYAPQEFEERWQRAWEEQGLFRAAETTNKKKFYCLDYFPYPSGEGLHVGHCRNYVPTDVISRFYRMRGLEVLHPMGWDAFGEPTEQHAILHGIHPRLTTDRNTANFKRQMRLIGTSYDWSREIDSSRPEYYRWTQFMFLRMYQRGLVYRDQNWQWWCPTCGTTLSSHEIKDDRCWRGHSGVTKKEIPAWFFRITAYADELLESLDDLDWPESIKAMQSHWIGRMPGSQIDFPLADGQGRLTVFTTRPDTLFGVTYLLIAPEHPQLLEYVQPEQTVHVEAYRGKASVRPEMERTAQDGLKSGVFTGSYAHHPLSGEKLPIWTADYVLASYGTGIVMGVPAHDERDYEFAQKYALPVRTVIEPFDKQDGQADGAYTGVGRLVNSGNFDGLPSQHGGERIMAELGERGLGRDAVAYRLRDWLISRQRYWGTPIPIVYCPECGEVPLPEEDLPLQLPPMEDFAPDGSGRAPLGRVPGFVHTQCPRCAGPARRETDTLGGFACSSWYFLRFTSPDYAAGPFDPERMRYWMPVDLYVGGAEHAVLHLLYARFWTKFLADEGLLSFREPFARLVNQGQLHGIDGYRMSKSRGNVVTPDEMVAAYGADALRLHVMFMAPFENDVDWSVEGLRGTRRFLQRLWSLYAESDVPDEAFPADDQELERALHQTTQAVTERIETFRFNTMVSELMTFSNLLFDRWRAGRWRTSVFQQALTTFLLLLAPAAPYIAEELWRRGGRSGSVHSQEWPHYDQDQLQEEILEIPVQVDGKVRSVLMVSPTWQKERIETLAREDDAVQQALAGRQINRYIHVTGKIVNIVTSPLK